MKNEENFHLKPMDLDRFAVVYAAMERNFVPAERRDSADARALLNRKEYRIFEAMDGTDAVGFVTVWELEGFCFIEHFVIYEDYRNRGYGARVLALLKENYRMLVLEAEPPETELQTRRIRFYERSGFFVNDVNYVQPPYREGGEAVKLLLLSCPAPLADADAVISELYRRVYENAKLSFFDYTQKHVTGESK